MFCDIPTFPRACIFSLLTLSLSDLLTSDFLHVRVSSWLCFFLAVLFPFVHIVGSLASKLPSIISVYHWCTMSVYWLVGTGTDMTLTFPFSWEVRNPNWRTHIFRRGRYTTNQYIIDCIMISVLSQKHQWNDGFISFISISGVGLSWNAWEKTKAGWAQTIPSLALWWRGGTFGRNGWEDCLYDWT